MFIKLLNWHRSIVITGLMVLLLLLGSSTFSPETKLFWAGWWVQQQGLGPAIWQSKKVRVKLPSWYLRLRRAIHRWRRWLKGKNLLWWVCCLLVLTAVAWVWLLRWVIWRMMQDESSPSWQGDWGWVGFLPEQSAVMQVQVQVRVTRDWVEESKPVYQLPGRETIETTLMAETREVSGAEMLNSKAALVLSDELGRELVWAYPGANQPGSEFLRPQLPDGQSPFKSVEEREEGEGVGQESEAEQGQTTPLNIIASHFSELKDPRVERTRKHQLLDIVSIAICAVVGGADNWVEVSEFGKSKEEWFKTFLALPNGIPSHDTFGRVFRLLDPQQWQAGFLSWVREVAQETQGQIVPIDGKCLRRSHDKTLGRKAIHMVSAWASDSRVVLGQVKVDEKSNEITAIPALLDILTLSGCIVTIDAMGCQKEIAKKIIEKDADYVLALKKNQNGLYEGVRSLFDRAQQNDFEPHHYHKTVEKSHGRQEIRQCWTISDPKQLSELHNLSAWQGLQTVVRVRAEQQRGHKTTIEDRYFISSLSGEALKMLQAVRGHWSIENSLHWVLDIAFREDDSRIRKGYGAQNFAVLRHLALNLLGQETSAKCGIKAKRKKAGWDVDFLLNILANST